MSIVFSDRESTSPIASNTKGLYGVIAYSVARRTNEIGVRMALGVQPADLMRTILGESIVLVLIGFAAGLPAALSCGHLVPAPIVTPPMNIARTPRQ